MTNQNKPEETITITKKDLDNLTQQLKAQILNDLANEKKLEEEQSQKRREGEKAEHERYVAKMKESPDPWVDIIGWVHTDEGVKVELEWNDPFIKFLRESGIAGSDEEQIVQKWIVMLMSDMTEQMGDTSQQGGSSFGG